MDLELGLTRTHTRAVIFWLEIILLKVVRVAFAREISKVVATVGRGWTHDTLGTTFQS